MTVFIRGPQGCGKGIHAPIMARHFGCEQIIDDWNGTDPVPADALVLTNLEAFSPPPGATVMPFAEAMRRSGLRPFALVTDECRPALFAAQMLRINAEHLSSMEGDFPPLKAKALRIRASLLEEASTRASLLPAETQCPESSLPAPSRVSS